MTDEPTTLEAEVLEIDGVSQAPQSPPRRTKRAKKDPWYGWRRMSQFVLKLDRRWWPLWVLLGAIAFALLVTVGTVFAMAWVVFAILRNLGRSFLALFGAPETSMRY